MKIIFKSFNNNYLETISFQNLENLQENFKKTTSINAPIEADIFTINESISAKQLFKLKNYFAKNNINFLRIYSNDRNTILAGKSLRIDSNYCKEKEVKNKLRLFHSNNKDDLLHEGTVRSGDRISSNGNLCIIGDVNPGAIISAKKNIYVWGKLLGIAFAGIDGDNDAFIASLYLNPLQLRIANVIAIGPKDKPKNYYPEVALIDEETINIKPYIIETKN